MTMDSESKPKPEDAQLNDLRCDAEPTREYDAEPTREYDAEPIREPRGDTLLPLRFAGGSVE